MAQPDRNRPLLPQSTRQKSQRHALIVKLVCSTLFVLLLALVLSHLDVRHDLRRLDVGVLSGTPAGNYHRLVEQLGDLAAKGRGSVRNLASEGSADNLARLWAARQRCDASAALAQDGLALGQAAPVLLGRLPKAESVVFLGRDGDAIHDFAQLAGMRIGVGPEGSGVAQVAKQLFALPEFAALQIKPSHHALTEQLALAAKGELDLAMLVIDEDAALLSYAVLQQGLQLVGFRHADVIARRLPHLRTGRIGAGQYDAVALLPKEDKRVLRVETLVLSNGCGGRSQTMDLLTLLARQFPEFVRHNRTPNTTGLPLDPAAHDFFERGGPELADQYLPWLVDVMPPANWVYVVMGVSLLFNVMDFGHRFRLWRIDAARVALESKLAKAFGPGITVGELARTEPDPARAALAGQIVEDLEELSARSRRYSLSLLVPMGAEMTYRYQEELMHQTLSALREYQMRTHSSRPPPRAPLNSA